MQESTNGTCNSVYQKDTNQLSYLDKAGTLLSCDVPEEPILNEENNFKVKIYLAIEDTVKKCINRELELCTHHEASLCFL